MLIDVGSGSHPHPQAEVTCDLYVNAEFEGDPMQMQNNFLICDAQYLPFRTQTFEESNCTHVLEHLQDPRLGFRELQRVSKRGYIETPSLLYENILFGYPFHYWGFTMKNGKMFYSKSKRLRICGKTIIPLGWFLHAISLHKRLVSIVMPVRRIPLLFLHYRWS